MAANSGCSLLASSAAISAVAAPATAGSLDRSPERNSRFRSSKSSASSRASSASRAALADGVRSEHAQERPQVLGRRAGQRPRQPLVDDLVDVAALVGIGRFAQCF